MHEITQLILLQELLGQVLEVTFAEVDVTDDGDFAAVALDFDGGAELTGFTVDLELVVQEVFLKGMGIEDMRERGKWNTEYNGI